jgi:hypothetical protein
MKSIDAAGSFNAIGRQVGQATKEDILHVVAATREFLSRKSAIADIAEADRIAVDVLRDTAARYPKAMEYLLGLSEGSGVPFADITLVAFSEEIMAWAAVPVSKCSTLAVPTAQGWVIGHNEDYQSHYLGRMFILHMWPDGHPQTASLNYPGQLPCLAGTLNRNGFSVTNNSLWPATQKGPSLQARHFMATQAGSFREAVKILTSEPSALTSHFTVAGGEDDELFSIEVSNQAIATVDLAVVPVDGPFCHTNHVLYLPLRDRDPANESSYQRYDKLRSIIDAGRLPSSPDAMMDLLSMEDGVLCRSAQQCPDSTTLATVVIRPKTRHLTVMEHGSGAATHSIHL